MGRIYSDTEKMLEAAKASSNGHHRKAASIYQKMGNEYRKPSEKKELWAAAENARGKS